MNRPRVVEMPAVAFHEMVGDPDVFVGGGSVAALTGAAACSTALLVMRLNARRKSLRSVQPSIERAILDVEDIAEACATAADDDIEILAELLKAHREARQSGIDARYIEALTAAAESPLRIATSILDLMAIIGDQIPLSTRFTVSDLGAAAVIAGGSCQAALLTAEVNIALLLEHPGSDRHLLQALDLQREELRARAVQAGSDLEQRTRELLRGAANTKGSE